MTQKELDLEVANRLENLANELPNMTQLSETEIFNFTAALNYAITTLRGNDNALTVDTTCSHCDSGYAQGYSDGYLKGIEERSTGDWIIEENNKYYPEGMATCSQCGYKMDVQRWEWLPALRWYLKPNFCPECGADMRKEKKE